MTLFVKYGGSVIYICDFDHTFDHVFEGKSLGIDHYDWFYERVDGQLKSIHITNL